MTKKRYATVAGLLTALVFLGVSVISLLPPRPGVTKANFDRIIEGMTEAEVEAVFGQKPLPPLMWNGCLGFHVESWQNQDGSEANIHFNLDSVTEKYWSASTETIIEKLQRLLLHGPPHPPAIRVGTSLIGISSFDNVGAVGR